MTKKEFEAIIESFDIGERYEDCVIYALCEPNTNIVRYVGQSVDLPSRITAHLYEDKIQEKLEWIQSLRVQGKFPTVKVLEIIKKNTFNIYITEDDYINQYSGQGFHLFNVPKPRLANQCKHSYFSLEILSSGTFLMCRDCSKRIDIIILECDHVYTEKLNGSNMFVCIRCGINQELKK